MQCRFYGLVSWFLLTLRSNYSFTEKKILFITIYIDILMDGPPAQSLGVEPVDADIMRQLPRKKNAPILTSALIMRVLTSAAVMVAGTLFIYIKEMCDGIFIARDTTMVR